MLQRQRRPAAAGPAAAGKIHSIAGVLRGREVSGQLEAGGKTYAFSFAPSSVTVAGEKIELAGDFTAALAGTGKVAKVAGVRATLASTQGGLGQAPVVRRELLAATAQGAETGTPDRQERDEPPPAEAKPEPASTLPVTEATGPTSFVGVMYLRLSPLDARALGVGADLSGVQLNVRLAPTSDTERELQWLFSGLLMAARGPQPDARSAAAHADAINRILKG